MSRDGRPADDGCSGAFAAEFFVLRTPLLPFNQWVTWSDGLQAPASIGDPARLVPALAADRARLRARLVEFVHQRTVRDALFIASPDLDDALAVWLDAADGARGARIERAVVRYFTRMAGRATPFGLFAATSVGTIADRTSLATAGREHYRRRSRLDMDYLSALADTIAGDSELRGVLMLHPNSSLYRAADRVRYIESRKAEHGRTHHLVAVEESEALDATLRRAAGGATAEALAEALVDEEIARSEAAAFIGELIDEQVLCPDVHLRLTGGDPAEALAAQLVSHSITSRVGERLAKVHSELAGLDAGGLGADPAQYRRLAELIGDLPVPVTLSTLFQVDMFKPAPDARLGTAVVDELLRGVDILRRLAPKPGPDHLSRFRDAFADRYGWREIPLTEALDEEAGIGFPPASETHADAGPLLQGIDLGEADDSSTVEWGPRERFLTRMLTKTLHAALPEISLDMGDLDRLEHTPGMPLPDAFAVRATMAAASDEAIARGDFRLRILGSDGPSGARLLGRFCHADPDLHGAVERHLRAEEALDPDALFAEVVHLPEGRLGNVLLRPVLREYEIPFLACSGAPHDRQIPITDLRISVSGDRIILRSARLGRRVVPRMTTAHYFRAANVGLYRFLCELQGEGVAGSMSWDWGPLVSAEFLPRVVSGRLVLSLAQWKVDGNELKRLGASHGADRFLAVQSWRAARRLPRRIVLIDGDHLLPIDLDNVLSVETFVHLVKNRDDATLTELFPGPDEMCARGPEGRFAHELVVPFVRRSDRLPQASDRQAVSRRRAPATASGRTFPPGSEWIYLKLYTGVSTADRTLVDVVRPLVEKAIESGSADRWFFIRYGDPDWHLRVRFHVATGRQRRRVKAALDAAIAATVGDGRVWKAQFDTYEREVERYGGAEGIDLAERIFHVDSDAVLALIQPGEQLTGLVALCGVHALFDDFQLDLDARRTTIRALRMQFARGFRVDTAAKRELADRFREESRTLDRLLLQGVDADSRLIPAREALRQRSARLAPLVAELRDLHRSGRIARPLPALAESYVHMHVNRLLRAAHRRQELVLYDQLDRLYESHAMRLLNVDDRK